MKVTQDGYKVLGTTGYGIRKDNDGQWWLIDMDGVPLQSFFSLADLKNILDKGVDKKDQ